MIKRINITETDTTVSDIANITTDIVYVPGFAVGGEAEARVPILCNSLAEFERNFGSTAPVFAADQPYPTNFPDIAKNTNQDPITPGGDDYIMFAAGTSDPSYVYAKQLLTTGLSVVYERINKEITHTEIEAEVFDPTKYYNRGDLVIYNTHYYICINVSVVGDWNSADWTSAEVEYPEYDSNKSVSLKTGTELNLSEQSYSDYTVNVETFINEIEGSTGTYIFTYDGSNWKRDTRTVNLTTYGITLGTTALETNDTIIIVYESYFYKDLVIHNSNLYLCSARFGVDSGPFTSAWTGLVENYTPISAYDVTVERMYEAMTMEDTEEETSIYSIHGTISQVSDYDIKYITSGGYPTFEYDDNGSMLCNRLITLAEQRGDAIAFIDHTNNPYRPLAADNTNSVYFVAKGLSSDYATMITPYAEYDFGEMPGSFSYLLALARSLRTYPSWLPIAGVTRGLIPQIKRLCTSKTLTNAIADSYQTDPENSQSQASINAITLIRNQGYVIWGDRTLAQYTPGTTGFASLFLHMRNLICDVRKQCYVSAQRYMFEQNTDILWINFTNSIKNLLDQMVASSVVAYYKFTKIQPSNKTKISCKITIKPVYAVEAFDIEIVMTDEEIILE